MGLYYVRPSVGGWNLEDDWCNWVKIKENLLQRIWHCYVIFHCKKCEKLITKIGLKCLYCCWETATLGGRIPFYVLPYYSLPVQSQWLSPENPAPFIYKTWLTQDDWNIVLKMYETTYIMPYKHPNVAARPIQWDQQNHDFEADFS